MSWSDWIESANIWRLHRFDTAFMRQIALIKNLKHMTLFITKSWSYWFDKWLVIHYHFPYEDKFSLLLLRRFFYSIPANSGQMDKWTMDGIHQKNQSSNRDMSWIPFIGKISELWNPVNIAWLCNQNFGQTGSHFAAIHFPDLVTFRLPGSAVLSMDGLNSRFWIHMTPGCI
jgi:hypothetical protein